jgi:hypothetical protein
VHSIHSVTLFPISLSLFSLCVHLSAMRLRLWQKHILIIINYGGPLGIADCLSLCFLELCPPLCQPLLLRPAIFFSCVRVAPPLSLYNQGGPFCVRNQRKQSNIYPFYFYFFSLFCRINRTLKGNPHRYLHLLCSATVTDFTSLSAHERKESFYYTSQP